MSTTSPDSLDIDEQIARIRRAQVETDKLSAETRKLLAEQAKLFAEQLKLQRDTKVVPWTVAVALLGGGAAIFAAGAGFLKAVGG